VSKGLISSNYTAQSHYSRSQFKVPDAEKLYRLVKFWWYFVVYKVDLDFVNILLELPLEDKQMDVLQTLRFELSKKLLYNL
jgi:hypothetical protein